MTERRGNLIAGVLIGLIVLAILAANVSYVIETLDRNEFSELCCREADLIREVKKGDEGARVELIELYKKKSGAVTKVNMGAIQVKIVQEECRVRVGMLESHTETW
jgi:hypothetical protein